ncbi:MAG: HAD-IC family P-type ATPase [Acidimicrobiia bacterium]|nr:HAD-IC family P-type ATPase [Acidimicrobiia bacterium]
MTSSVTDDAELAATGLSESAVAERRARGQVNVAVEGPSRTTSRIVRTNLFTWFNGLMSTLFVIVLVFGSPADALFGIVVAVNALIGIVQELRAKRTLDRLALVSAPRVRIVRSGKVVEAATGDVVLGDVLEVGMGDQIVVDGDVLATDGVEVDESLLTGESDPVPKRAGDGLMSGAFVLSGSCRFRATAVGADAYANTLAGQARQFTLVRSELRDGIQNLVRLITWFLIPTALLLLWGQLRTDHEFNDAVVASVAGIVGMVPEGLVLLTSIAFTVGMIRLGRRGVLVQELPAVEGLARVDTLCVDKTGTLTRGHLQVTELELLDPDAPATAALGALAAAEARPNATLAAVAAAYPRPHDWTAGERVPFSSARKWSGADFGDEGARRLGAPEVLVDEVGGLAGRVASIAPTGKRVLLLARAGGGLAGESTPACRPVALVVLADEIRPEAGPALDYFARQGVAIKVISGDNPDTVSAVARELGHTELEAVDARTLPGDTDGLAAALEEHNAFGRVTPEQKREMVHALQSRGHVVAMTGDGVNDVLALKDADIGIAMGNGSQATKGVAQLVLLDADFSTLPPAVGEGRRVIANIGRTARLFLTKTSYAFVFAIAVTALGLAYPFLPRHLTLIGQVTIGIPGFFLALAPDAPRARTGFVPRVLRFAVPAGLVLAAATLVVYYGVLDVFGFSGDEARTAAAVVLGCGGLIVLTLIARPLTGMRQLLVWVMSGLFLLAFVVPVAAGFYALEMRPLTWSLLAAGLATELGVALLVYFWDAIVRWRRARASTT